MLQSAGTTTFEYDYTGKRTKKGNVDYAYAGDKLIYEKSPNHTIYYFYDAKGISGFRYNNANYQYVKNTLGDVVGIVHNGQLVAHYTYDAWGACTILKDSAIAQLNPIRYRGYYYDTETGLYYCLTRYYNPAYGSFISPDTVDYLDPESINGLNLYCYCHNNPIMYADPSGHLALWLLIGIGAMVGATIAGAGSIVTQGIEKGWDKIDGRLVLLDMFFGAIDGALSVTGMGAFASIAVNAALTTSQILLTDLIEGDLGVDTLDNIVGSLVCGLMMFGVSSALSKYTPIKVGYDARKNVGIYNTSQGYLKTLKSPKKIAMYEGKIERVIKTVIHGTMGYAMFSMSERFLSFGAEQLFGW